MALAGTPRDRGPRVEIMHAVEDAKQRRLSASQGADKRRDVAIIKEDDNVLERLGGSIEEIKPSHINPWRQRLSASIARRCPRVPVHHARENCSIAISRLRRLQLREVVIRNHQQKGNWQFILLGDERSDRCDDAPLAVVHYTIEFPVDVVVQHVMINVIKGRPGAQARAPWPPRYRTTRR